MAATRRLAAVLAADLVGYSRLMGLDEEGTLVRLRALRSEILDPKIAENSGRLVKTTGDGFLVEFNSVIDALRCAKDVHGAMGKLEAPDPDRRFMLRIGVHQGDIVVEDGDIFGNGVNIAARLEGIAEPGGICVSERVQEDAAGRIDLIFEDIGEQQLKNIARPIRAFRVRVAPPVAAPTPEPVPRVERAATEPPPPQEVQPAPPEPPAQPEVTVAAPPPPEPPAVERIEPPPAVEPTLPPPPAQAEEPVLFPFLAARFSAQLPGGIACSHQQLQALVSEWLGRTVEIVQAEGSWVPLSPTRRSRLPIGGDAGMLNRLGIETTIGLRAWRAPAPMVIRVGPLDRASFEALLPDQPALQKLLSLLRAVLGTDAALAVNPILAGAELTPPRLDADPGAALRLGWNTWTPRPGGADAPDMRDALFEAAPVAAEERAPVAAAAD